VKKKLGIILGGMVILGAVIFVLAKNYIPAGLLSPLGIKQQIKKEKSLKVVGFLPTWMVGKTQDYCQEVTEMVFLGIEVNENGDLVWDVQGKKVSGDDYLEIKSKIKKCGGKNIVGIKLFDDNKIIKLMASSEAVNNLIEQIKETKESGGFDGINVDFEYMGDPSGVLGDEFFSFIDRLKQANLGEISVDVFANTVIKGDEQQLKRLIGTIDGLIVMAYDFHRPGMTYAGPVAPIRSVAGERNISEVVEKVVMSQLDKKKIIMAYPLYGYEWKTETTELGSKVLAGWSQMASYDRVQKIINDKTEKELVINYDELSMTPWLSFKETENITKTKWVKVKGKWKKQNYSVPVERIHQIYYDDLRSLKIKIDLAKQSNLGGTGFWALGYEGDDKEVWKMINQEL